MNFGRKKQDMRNNPIGFSRNEPPPQSERLKPTVTGGDIRKRKDSNRLSARILSGISTLVFLTGLILYARLPEFRVSSVTVYGHETVNADEVIYYTGMKDQPIFLANKELIEDSVLRRYPENRDITAKVRLPNRLELYFEQRVAVIEWDFGGEQFWLDRDGVVFRENASGSPEIIVYANSFPGALNWKDRTIPSKFRKDIVDAVLRIYAVKPENARLNFTYDNGFGWDSGKGFMLWIGIDDRELEEKMVMLNSLEQYFKENEIEPALVSLEFTDAPYYRYAD